jgi:proline iminopeptidase
VTGVLADDGCRLWATEVGAGGPLIVCHGGPGLWDMFGSLDHPDRVSALIYMSGTGLGWDWYEPFHRTAAARLAACEPRLSQLRGKDRTAAEDRELAILQWSAEFPGADASRPAEEMATPWFGVNRACYDGIWGELKRTWREPELVAACRALTVPVLIVDGETDLRPRWAVDSLERAPPRVTRVILPGVGHVPWLEKPGDVSSLLLEFLARQDRPAAPGGGNR